MTNLAQFVLDALSIGSTYALLALGLTLLFGVMGLINFAYGALIIWCGYVVVVLAPWNLPFALVAVLVVAAATVLSLLVGQFAFRPFKSAPPLTLMLTSFGVAMALQALAILVFGQASRVVPLPAALGTVWHLGEVRISVLQVVTIGAGAGVIAGLYGLLQHTTIGLQIRAVAEDAEIASQMGVRADRVLMWAFAASGVIAGIVALLWLAKIGTVSPGAFLSPTFKAFIAIVLGGLGSVRGAVVGGLVLGLFEASLATYLPDTILSYQQAIAFGLVIAVLLVRPSGIAGRIVEVSK